MVVLQDRTKFGLRFGNVFVSTLPQIVTRLKFLGDYFMHTIKGMLIHVKSVYPKCGVGPQRMRF